MPSGDAAQAGAYGAEQSRRVEQLLSSAELRRRGWAGASRGSPCKNEIMKAESESGLKREPPWAAEDDKEHDAFSHGMALIHAQELTLTWHGPHSRFIT